MPERGLLLWLRRERSCEVSGTMRPEKRRGHVREDPSRCHGRHPLLPSHTKARFSTSHHGESRLDMSPYNRTIDANALLMAQLHGVETTSYENVMCDWRGFALYREAGYVSVSSLQVWFRNPCD